ncbi:MAG: N-acetyltransferase [Planctomycetes bacterium]|nr:N-acetyltransferase [Planctomycetota bacterium]
MTEPLTVRVAGAADLPGIVEVYNQAVAVQATADLDPVTVAGRQGWFAAHDPQRYPILIAERGGTLAGWVSLSPHRPGRRAVRRAAEVSYYVHRDHRRQGVATSLVNAALERCPALGVDVVFAIVLADNVASLALLERLGFARWGLLPEVADFDGRRVGHVYCGKRL